jgi:hypothetical protein
MTMERDALMREVDEELRRDQLKKMWDEYGTYILAGAVAVLLGVGGYKWWEGRKAAAAERAGAQFEQALELATTGKSDEAQKLLKSIGSSGSAGYAMLSELALAGQAVKAGNAEAAIAAYEAAAARASDPTVKDFARLQSVSLKIDSADFTEVQNRLNDLVADKNPWRYMARELVGISAVRAGRLDDARNMLAPLAADPRAPAAVRERAGALMAIVVAGELERAAAGKVELEKTDEAPAASGAAPAPKDDAQRPKAAPPKGGAAKGK